MLGLGPVVSLELAFCQYGSYLPTMLWRLFRSRSPVPESFIEPLAAKPGAMLCRRGAASGSTRFKHGRLPVHFEGAWGGRGSLVGTIPRPSWRDVPMARGFDVHETGRA